MCVFPPIRIYSKIEYFLSLFVRAGTFWSIRLDLIIIFGTAFDLILTLFLLFTVRSPEQRFICAVPEVIDSGPKESAPEVLLPTVAAGLGMAQPESAGFCRITRFLLWLAMGAVE